MVAAEAAVEAGVAAAVEVAAEAGVAPKAVAVEAPAEAGAGAEESPPYALVRDLLRLLPLPISTHRNLRPTTSSLV